MANKKVDSFINSENSGGSRNNGKIKALNIVLSIVLAIILWAYVVGEINPDTEKTLDNVSLNVVGASTLEAKGLAVLTEFDDTVTAVVKGQRSEILGLSASDLSARIDVSDCIEGENQVVIRVTAPNNIEEAEALNANIVVNVDKIVSEEKPVEIVTSGALSKGSGVDVTTQNVETVTVTGPSTYVEKVHSVIGILKVSDDEKDYTETLSLVAVDDRGKAVKRVELDTTEVNVEAEKTLTKTLGLYIRYTGTESNGVKLDLPDTVNVSIKGRYDDIVDLNTLETGSINITGITEDTVKMLEVRLPLGVTAVDSFGEPLPDQEGGRISLSVEIKVRSKNMN